MKTVIKFVLPLLAAATLAACGQDAADTAAEKLAKEHGVDMDIDRDGDNATFTIGGKDGSKMQVGENVKLPDDFPSDVAVYPDLKLIAASVSNDNFSVHGETGDSLEKAASFFLDKMASNGWTKESEMAQDTIRLITFQKEGRDASVALTANEGNTSVQISAAKAK